MTTPSIENAVRHSLEVDEEVVTFASVLAGAASDALEVAVLVLTSRRLMLLSPAGDAEGYGLASSHERSSCTLVNDKQLSDGSRILIVRQKGGLLYVHLASSWSEEAAIIHDGLVPRAQQATETVSELPVDRFALIQEFAGLSMDPDVHEEEE